MRRARRHRDHRKPPPVSPGAGAVDADLNEFISSRTRAANARSSVATEKIELPFETFNAAMNSASVSTTHECECAEIRREDESIGQLAPDARQQRDGEVTARAIVARVSVSAGKPLSVSAGKPLCEGVTAVNALPACSCTSSACTRTLSG